ncbi:glycosyl hydrolase family 28-related protein [Agromyces badenianii]|uniref:glycosyl hydrolase family 28-related protein n=1 Tax=Agromyces badenianii TaxID=2080742 RepID=UPI000D59441A|nr:glycosyl hydrolase family 28-related protein [Agromyces badenianii]PWC05428.1 hypothetical protein DCE94_03915 [Agromyces badenianii]
MSAQGMPPVDQSYQLPSVVHERNGANNADPSTPEGAGIVTLLESTTDEIVAALVADPDSDTSEELVKLFVAPLAKSTAGSAAPAAYVNVRDFGAAGDGVADDSAAIRAAITAASGGVVFFPQGTYIVSPDGTGANNYCLKLSQGVTLAGEFGSVLQLADGVVNFYGVIGPAAVSTDLSGLTVTDLVIDMNGDNNVVDNPAVDMPSGYSRRGLAAFTGAGITTERLTFRNGQCVWYAEFLGENLFDVTVRDCVFENAGSNSYDWDHTSLYMDCANGLVQSNEFHTTKSGGARQAFELHGGVMHALNNIVDGYVYACDITGSQWRGPGTGTAIGNTFKNVTIGFDLWAKFSPSGQPGIKDFVIAGNTVFTDHAKSAGHRWSGFVSMNLGSDQSIENLSIRGNVFRLGALGSPDATYDQYSQAILIGRAESDGIVDRNIVIEGNIIDGSAAGGARLLLPDGTLHGFRLANNIFRNISKLGASAYDGSRNAALLAEMATAKGWDITGNQFIDDQATHTINRGFYLVVPTIDDIQVVDNRIWTADAVGIQQVGTTATAGQVYLRATVQKYSGPSGRFVKGSKLFDENLGQIRTNVTAGGSSWLVEIPGSLSVNNTAAATTPGTVVRKMQIFDATGTSLGYVPVYNAIT